MSVCRWIKDADVPGGKYLVPGCIGAAVYGYHGCTCGRRGTSRDDLERKIEKIEARLAKLEVLFAEVRPQ